MHKKNKPQLIVISSVSGGGKTSLIDWMIKRNSKICRAITTTTRSPRPREKNGKDYFFYSKENFLSDVSKRLFLEYAIVHGHYYGLQKKTLLQQIKENPMIILNMDYQGLLHLQSHLSDSYGIASIFIVPANIKVWQERLKARYGSHISEADFKLRVQNGLKELEQQHHYGYTVVNDQFEVAGKELLGLCEKIHQ